MLVLQILLASAAVIVLAWRPRSWTAAALPAGFAMIEVVLGATSAGTLGRSLLEAAPIGVFLVSVIWLARLADRAGLAQRLAGVLARNARGQRRRLYVLVCTLCAGLTATVSLDGAVVLMIPVLLALAPREPQLFRPLFFGTVAVANAFSFAVPQGNPTNLVVMSQLGLGPEAFVIHLFVPAVLAAVVCIVALAFAERRRLRGVYHPAGGSPTPFSADEKFAAAALTVAAVAGVASPWVGVAPWLVLSAVAAIAFAAARTTGRPTPSPRVPWRVWVQVAALLVLFDAVFAGLHAPLFTGPSLAALVVLSLTASATASSINNLPASVVFATMLGTRGLPAYATLAGLSVGALATPHGSVATLIAFDRAGAAADQLATSRYLTLWIPATVFATSAATLCLWFIARVH